MCIAALNEEKSRKVLLHKFHTISDSTTASHKVRIQMIFLIKEKKVLKIGKLPVHIVHPSVILALLQRRTMNIIKIACLWLFLNNTLKSFS